MNKGEQYVCTVCGYNMAGYLPDNCPFCGATKDHFITSQECSSKYKVVEMPVTDNVSRLNSYPKLGLEHAAYRIFTDNKTCWIDCPSCFDQSLPPMDTIMFTHFHFLGASNQYREHFSSSVRIHDDDSKFKLCRGFTFDKTFLANFAESGIEAYHIDGHTPGFTCYFFEDVFFICDYVFYRSKEMTFNPFGPGSRTVEGGFLYNLGIACLPLAMGITMFGTPIINAPVLMIAMILTAFCFATLGTLFATYSTENVGEVMSMLNTVRLPLISGVIIPISTMPQIGQKIALISPSPTEMI